jgi:hypothetical protein
MKDEDRGATAGVGSSIGVYDSLADRYDSRKRQMYPYRTESGTFPAWRRPPVAVHAGGPTGFRLTEIYGDGPSARVGFYGRWVSKALRY